MALPDAGGRERVVHGIRETLFVEAGAGTGKTTALVDRIVRLIASGESVERIAAITFTEKAAAELTDRVRRRLELAAAGENDLVASSATERERCRDAVGKLDGAAFQTIHAFARKLLAGYALQAGLPPEFEVLDDAEEGIELREEVRRFLDRIESDGATGGPLAVAYALGLKPHHLEDLARQFAQTWYRLRSDRFEPPEEEPDWEPVLGALLDEVETENQTSAFLPVRDKLREAAQRLAEMYRRWRDASPANRQSALVELLLAAGRVQIDTTVGRGKPLVPVKNGYEEWLGCIRTRALRQILPAVQRFALDYAEERRRAGRLTFEDLLVLAVDLLRNDAEVRRAVHERFGRLLIDEFQDTDPLQVELAALIAGDPGTVLGWQAAHVEQGRLFFVGDPKQSIYRFRHADIGIYLAAKEAFDARQELLTTNFRSTRSIVTWVNGVCGSLFDRDPASGHQAPWVPLETHGEAPQGRPVRVFGGLVDAPAREVRELEATEVARGVLQACAENWAERDGGTRFADITVLMPRRSGLATLERALADHGIPYRIESRSLLFDSDEVRDLANVLRAIDDPNDRVALVAALRSPLFACSDAELAQHVRLGGRWTYERAAPEGSPERLRRALERLGCWHRERWTMTPAGLIERVVGDCNMLLAAVGDLRPREAWRRYRLLAEQARSLTVRGAVATLRQFVDWLEQQQDEGVRINEAIVPEPDDDAVRIMTIHAAKGLEFPVVFVVGLGGLAGRRSGVSVWWPREEVGLPEVACRSQGASFETAGARSREGEEASHKESEAVRLFYVAATRAERALAVSLYRSKRDDRQSIARAVEEAVTRAGEENRERSTSPSAFDAGVAAYTMGQNAAGPAVPSRAAWQAERERIIARYGKAPVAAATAIAQTEAPDLPEEPEEGPATPDEPWRKGRAGTSIGRAVHAVLQNIDLATGEGIAEAARAQAEAEGIADRADEVERLVRGAFASAEVRAAVASGRYWREVYVGGEVDGVLIEGFIDLLYEGPNGLVIVDYKTDSLQTAGELDAAMERYRLQGAAYALATERAVGSSVVRVVFVFTEPRVDREVTDLEAAKAVARARARAIAGFGG